MPVGAGASKFDTKALVNCSTSETAREVVSSVFHTYTKEEKEFARKIQQITNSDGYETAINGMFEYGCDGYVEYEKEKK